jgi:Delta7-sterol 5-desaturase
MIIKVKYFLWLLQFCTIYMGLRYVLLAGLAYLVFWKVFARKMDARRIQERRPTRAERLNEAKLALVTSFTFGLVVALVLFLNENYGLFKIYSQPDRYGWGYFWFTVVVMVLAHDTYFYWVHRAMHSRWLFGWVHAQHHRSRTPSPWTAYALSPAEALLNVLIVPLMGALIPISELALNIFFGWMLVFNVHLHLGFVLFPRGFAKRWFWWFIPAVHHDLHHQDSRGNFGLYYTWWDSLMKTVHPRYEETVERFAALPSQPRETS